MTEMGGQHHRNIHYSVPFENFEFVKGLIIRYYERGEPSHHPDERMSERRHPFFV